MIISGQALRAAIVAAAKADYQRAMTHLQVQAPKGKESATVIATNGHLAVLIQDRYPFPDTEFPKDGLPTYHADPSKPVLVPPDVVERLGKTLPKKPTIPILSAVQIGTNGDGKPYLAATDLKIPTVVSLPEPGDLPSYPDVAKVIPPEDRAVRKVILSREMIETIAKIAKTVDAKMLHFEIPAAEEHYQDQTKAIGELKSALQVRCTGSDQTVRMIVMPCRG